MTVNPKRLGIFVFFDSKGIVDDYIPYLLKDMCQNLEHLIVVCNGVVNNEGILKLRKFTDDVFIRENREYDAGAIKDVLYNFYGWEQVYRYDELVLFNDSFFGPLYPFKIIFDKMDSLNVDFWGLSEQCEFAKAFPEEDECFPFHLQSFFTVIRENLFKTEDYKSFWETMPPLNTFIDAVNWYEIRMKQYFVEKGYTGSAFTDFSQLMSSNSNNNYLYTYDTPYETIYECKYPILKRKSLVRENYFILENSNAEGNALIMDYIAKNTSYNVNLIWDNILRVYDIADLRYTIHLDKVLPSRAKNSAVNTIDTKRIAIVVKISNPVFINELQKYLKRTPPSVRIIITDEPYKLNDIIKDFEYICFIQDIPFVSDTSLKVMQSAIFTILENLIKSPEYIENIANEFDENPRLGLLTPPHSLHSYFFSAFGGDWEEDFDEAQQFAEDLCLRKLSPLKRPFMSESAFWCRTKVLKRLHGRDISQGFTVAEIKALPYVAQAEGYYSAVVMSDEYASLQSTNCEYMLSKFIDFQKKQSDFATGKFGFNDFILSHKYSKMISFCSKYDRVYVYGAGDIASRCAKFLIRSNIVFEGFVVSDGRPKTNELFGHLVRYLSELEPPDERVGIVLGMENSNTVQVYPLLQQKGYRNLFTID